MASSIFNPDLSGNALAMTREKKLSELMALWYEAVVKVAPPPLNDPDLLRYETKTDYYYTYSLIWPWTLNARIYDPPVDPPPPQISVDWIAVDRLIQSALTNTTGDQINQGYGTCVIQSFEGKYYYEPCIFKVIVVAISFTFSAREYMTLYDVSALGYWIYWFRSRPPFRHRGGVLEPSGVEPLAYQVPPDMSIVGRKYMTVAELDRFNP